MIVLQGKTKNDMLTLRNSIYSTRVEGQPYDFQSQEWLDAVALVDNYCIKAGINKSDYVFDLWSGVVFTKEEQRTGAIKTYRQSIGLVP